MVLNGPLWTTDSEDSRLCSKTADYIVASTLSFQLVAWIFHDAYHT